MRAKRLGLLAAALLLAGPATAEATSLTLLMSGTIDFVQGDELVSLGTPFSLSVTFDDSAPDLQSDPSDGFYTFSPPSSFVLDVGSYMVAAPPTPSGGSFFIDVLNDAEGDPGFVFDQIRGSTFGVAVVDGPLPSPPTLAGITFLLSNENASGIQSDALSSVPWDLSRWPAAGLQFDIHGTGYAFTGVGAFGSLTAIPEPSTALFIALGLCGLAARRRRFV